MAKKSPFLLLLHATLVLVCAGFFLYASQKAHRAGIQEILRQQQVTILARVLEKDRWSESGSLFRLSVKRVWGKNNGCLPVGSFDIQCYVKNPVDIMVGDAIVVHNAQIMPPILTSVTGNPSYDDYLAKRHIISSLFLQNEWQIKCLHRPTWSLKRSIAAWREDLFARCTQKLSPLTQAYYGLIF